MDYLQLGIVIKKGKFYTFPYLLMPSYNYCLHPLQLPPDRQCPFCCPASCSLVVYPINFYLLCFALG